MQSPKIAIVKAITLLTLENRAGAELSQDLIKELIDLTPTTDDGAIADIDKESYHNLRNYMVELARLDKKEFPHEKDISQRIELICKDDSQLYEVFSRLIDDDEFKDKEGAGALAISTRNSLIRIINEGKSESLIEKFIRDYRFKRDNVEIGSALTKLAEDVAKYKGTGNDLDPDERHTINFGDIESIKNTFTVAKTKVSNEGILRTGWKCWNRMLGSAYGFKRGEDCIISACQYNYKSGAVLNLFAQLTYFNKPHVFDSTKKPAAVFVTLENDTDNNLALLYQNIYENVTGEQADMANFDLEEASAFVHEFFTKNGWEVVMVKMVGQDTTVHGFVQWLESLKKRGYEICFLIVDYFNLLSKEGIYSTFTGQDVTLAYQKIANYCRDELITFITPHQLSSEATTLRRELGEGFAVRVAGRNFYDNSKRLAQEPSLEITINIVERKDTSYLEAARGKHRTEMKTPSKDRSCTMQFQDIGTLPWDEDTDNDFTVDMSANLFDNEFDSDF